MAHENELNDVLTHQITITSRVGVKQYDDLAMLLPDTTVLKKLKEQHAISVRLYNNRTPRADRPDTKGFKKSVDGYGLTQWIVYTDGVKAYILVWKNKKKYWFDTHLC